MGRGKGLTSGRCIAHTWGQWWQQPVADTQLAPTSSRQQASSRWTASLNQDQIFPTEHNLQNDLAIFLFAEGVHVQSAYIHAVLKLFSSAVSNHSRSEMYLQVFEIVLIFYSGLNVQCYSSQKQQELIGLWAKVACFFSWLSFLLLPKTMFCSKSVDEFCSDYTSDVTNRTQLQIARKHKLKM